MSQSRLVNILLAVGVGVGTGFYVFDPLLREYHTDTKGTWMLPGDEERLRRIEAAKHEAEQKAEGTVETHVSEEKKDFPISKTT
ncbi:hypothetical protein BCR43DRAFT_485753 [Syncephalastrum racemosum]|uniref:Uncharacterized protein n=1 Tax=Syncephalastrum racemosum TaxID=13706 RepID=A0A1X2HN00_SYNRA|nr:hypothetical protein BCR43DRAFT_485753 [Syncephalastrum racemosum]